MTYCDYIGTIAGDQLQLHKEYHDNHYGFPIKDDDRLFERLMFEINQAGLNWILILKKQHNFRKAFDNFDIDKVASYGEKEFHRLMNDAGIIEPITCKKRNDVVPFSPRNIVDSNGDDVRCVRTKDRTDLERKWRVAAFVITEICSVEPHVAHIIHGIERQSCDLLLQRVRHGK